jgi:hypothetical protein
VNGTIVREIYVGACGVKLTQPIKARATDRLGPGSSPKGQARDVRSRMVTSLRGILVPVRFSSPFPLSFVAKRSRFSSGMVRYYMASKVDYTSTKINYIASEFLCMIDLNKISNKNYWNKEENHAREAVTCEG